MKWIKIVVSIVILCAFAAVWTYWSVFRELPTETELEELIPTSVTKVIGADGSVIGYFPPDGMIIIESGKIPDIFRKAFISAEDASFYEHQGIDTSRIFVAALKDMFSISFSHGGASTITQQVVRSYFLTREKTIARKLKEAILAVRIEKELTKDQIFNLYLNRIYLGGGAYGVESASLRYFDKHCWDLSLPEIALIVGLAPAPSRYSPLNNFSAAKKRQWYVLSRMAKEGYISKAMAKEAYNTPLRITGKPGESFSKYPYVTEYVKNMVTEMFGEEALSAGLTIYTTIIPSMQAAAEEAVWQGAIDVEMRQGNYRGPLRGKGDEEKEGLFAFQENQLKISKPQYGHLYWAEVKSTEPLVVDMNGRQITLGPRSYEWINPKGKWKPQDVLEPGDLTQLYYTSGGFLISQEPLVQAALCAFDVENSEMIALMGGVDFSKSQFNRAISAYRQTGSAIKPFIYSAAIDKGLTAASIIVDIPVSYDLNEDEEKWRPKNYDDKYYGPTTLRTGLVLSRNVVTVRLLETIGIGYAIDYLKKFDISKDLPRDLSLALGSASTTPFDLAKAYGTFATYGFRFEPSVIKSIDQEGVGTVYSVSPVLYEETSDMMISNMRLAERIISEQTAYIITNILTDAVQNGTGQRAKALKKPVAGKTGTSNDSRDAWFVGYTPKFLCGVWVGYDDMSPLGKGEVGGNAACPIFVNFMYSLLGDAPVMDFRVPEGIVFAQIDTKTGKPTTSSSTMRYECFKEGTLPAEDKSSSPLLKEVY